MCGPTQSQTDLENQQAAFYQQATQEATTTYGEDQALLQQMQSVYDPILAKGPNQKGFSTEEEEGLNAQAVEGTAENYAGAAKSVNENLAAEGGGTNPLPSGGQEQLKEQVAESAAQTESSEEEQIQQADYAQGSQQFSQATAALEDVSGQYNPTAYTGAATGAGSAASTTANEIAQENNSWVNAAIGAAGTIGAGAVTKYCWIAAELYGGWSDPRTVKVRTWLINKYSRTIVGHIVCAMYARWGKQTAEAIRRHPWLRHVFLPIFNLALRKAGE